MTFTTATGSEALTDHKLLRLSGFANVLPALELRDLTSTAIVDLLVQHSKSFHSSHNVSFREAHTADVARDLVSRGLMQGAIKSSCRCCVRVTKLLGPVPEALHLIENLSDEAASSGSSSARSARGATRLENAVLFSVEGHDILLCIEAAAAHTRGEKQSPHFNGRVFYSYAGSSLQEPKNLHRSAGKKCLSTFEEFLLTENPQTECFFLPVKTMYTNTRSPSSFDVADKK